MHKNLTICIKTTQFAQYQHRGEYFYSVGVKQLQVIFFSSCRNIQFGVFCAEIFILWCIVKKYWSGIVTCYMKMRQINELHADLASFLLNCARKKHFFGGFVQKCHFFWGLCRNITVPSYCTSGVLCRAFFRGCAEILIFGEIFTSGPLARGPSTRRCSTMPPGVQNMCQRVSTADRHFLAALAALYLPLSFIH